MTFGGDVTEPVGRQRECGALIGFLDRLAGGQGGVLLLEGEGGTGKTTLAEWAAQRAGERGFAVLTGRSWEMSQSVPYEPVVAALGRFLRNQTDPVASELTRGLSSLATLIDGLDVSDRPDEIMADASRVRLHDAVATLLSRIAESQPVFFLFDDLHWSDSSSLEIVQFICRDLPYVAIGLVATVRPSDADERPEVRNFIAPLRRMTFSSSVTVRNLDWNETALVIRNRLGGEPPARLLELVWSRSIGTPLLVREMIEDLIGRSVLINTGLGWTLTESDPPLPRVAADLIRDRVDRAKPAERQLLEILAVADESTRLEVLTAVASMEPDQAAELLRRLIDQRLVAESVDAHGQITWHAEHPIISHVVAEQLDALVRQRLHRRLGEADVTASIARQARHIMGGGPPLDPIAAADLLTAAGDEALAQGATLQAIDNYRAAGALLARGSGADDPPDSRIDSLVFRLNVGTGTAMTRLRRLDEALPLLEKAWAYAEHHEIPKQQLAVISILDLAVFLSGGSTSSVVAKLNTVEAVLDDLQDWDLLIELHMTRFLIDGRGGAIHAPAEARRSLDHIGDRPLSSRAAAIRELLHISCEITDLKANAPGPTIDRLMVIASGDDDQDIRRRACLVALDLAGCLGVPETVGRVIARTRNVEAEMGEWPNWRLPLLRSIEEAVDGQTSTELELLDQAGEVLRSSVLIALVNCLGDRYRVGSDAALARFDEACAAVDVSSDDVAQTYLLLGRLIVGEGCSSEAQLAEGAFIKSINERGIVSSPVALMDHAGVLAACLSGTRDDALAAIARLPDSEDVSDLPAAWRELAFARLCADQKARAGHLLAAASHLDACNYRLEAASRRIEAAEIHRASLDDHTLAETLTILSECGATSLLDRAAAIAPALMPSPKRAIDDGLTKREWEVAVQVAKGLTNREVGQELFISIRTVTSHLDHIYTKLGLSSRAELSAYVERGTPNT